MVEDAGAADLISGGRLQLSISRGSPEQVIEGWRYLGYEPAAGETDAETGHRKALEFLDKLKGTGFAQRNPYPMFPSPPGLLRLEPHAECLGEQICGKPLPMQPPFGQLRTVCTCKVPPYSLTKAGNLSISSRRNRPGYIKKPGKKQDTSRNHGYP